MSNVSNKQFMPMNKHYAQLDQSSVQADKPLELAPPVASVNKFLKGGSPAPKENSVLMNKESLEKLFAMFEFVVNAMRSMLAGMGVLPRQPGELDAQPQVKPGLDTKTTVLPGTDAKVVPDAKAEHKVAPEADTKTLVKPGSEVKVMPDGRTQMTTSPDGKLDAQPARPSLIPEDYKNKPSDVNVTVQVQNCHCPHTGEKVMPQPPLMPGLDTNPSPQPAVTPPTPDLTCPAPDDLVDDFSGHSQTRFDNHRANRPSLRSRF